MCSVVGYIGKNKSKAFVLEGLSRLEYRGYDSVGFACLSQENNTIVSAKAVGGLDNLTHMFTMAHIDGFLGIGHSRWATHGQPSESNAHPHFDCQKTVAIVHNGIIENYLSLKKDLELLGHVFYSDTDTEVIAHVFEALLVATSDMENKHKTLAQVVVSLVSRLTGAYAFMALVQGYPDTLILVRQRPPLCVGIGDNEMFVASDAFAFAGKTDKVFFLPEESFAFVKKNEIQLYDFAGNALPVHMQALDLSWQDSQKNEHEHFMLKEIYEQKAVIHKTIDSLQALHDTIWDYMGITAQQIRTLDHISFIGCGTSWHAARLAQFFFEQVCKMNSSVHLASEFRYMTFFPTQHKIHLAISQSGETADTLEALRVINAHTMPTVALTNVASSTIVREAGGFLLTQAGREIAVASTKAFSTQLAALYWLAHRIALEKGLIAQADMVQACADVIYAAQVLEASIEKYKHEISAYHARKYATYSKAIFLGRNSSYPFAMEAALKLKEIAYIFAQCYPAGELKHGPLALIDEHTPVFIFSHQDSLIYHKLLSNAQEVKARNGHVVAFVFEGQDEMCALADLYFVVPNVAPLLGQLAMTGLMQFFMYAIAKELGCPIDKPRNLAKSVTVE
ncbi:MAG: glutamine--fructose-6-phosphate transaminase (isomerizing) [Candidatus Dependentiae bacterium]|nr:glutamine--fructose-6-phosphate transaminase (isomerizing) [Candidatus Dependentiae bacterium]